MTDPTPTELSTAASEHPAAWRYVAGLFALCLLCTAVTTWIGRDRDQIRNPDEAAYAEQASSLIESGRFDTSSVRFFHVQHPPEITRPEDFYPPGNGVLLAATWKLFGRSDFSNSLPSIFIACLLLPLLAFALARRLSASPPFAFGCGVAVLAEPLFRFHAYQGLADLPFTACVVGTTLAVLRGRPLATALGGALLGVAFWFKPTALLFGPAFGLAILIVSTDHWRTRVLRLVWFGLGFAVVAAPWLLRNLELFGDPVYSGNQHLTATANDPNYRYSHIRKVYWHSDDVVPSLAGSATEYGIGPVLRRFAMHIYEIVSIHGAAAFGLWFVLGVLVLRRSRPVVAVAAIITAFCVALSAVFAVFYRYLMPLFPLVAAVSWTLADQVVAAVRRSDHPLARLGLTRSSTRMALVLAAIIAVPSGTEVLRDLRYGKTDFGEATDRGAQVAARWARDHLPADSVLMVHEALRFRHYSGHRTVNTPWDVPGAIEAVVDHYGIEYAIQTFSGDSASQSNAYFIPYMSQFGSKWTRHDIPDSGAAVWVRDGAAPPR